jgi:hypothetical protein
VADTSWWRWRRCCNRFPTLIAIDRYNYLWDNTTYYDPADVNRGNFRHLDAQKLMLTKMFSNHQDHGLVHMPTLHTGVMMMIMT